MANVEIACRENWQSGPENEERGMKWLNTIYKHNRTKTMEPMMAHKDFGMSLSFPSDALSPSSSSSFSVTPNQCIFSTTHPY